MKLDGVAEQIRRKMASRGIHPEAIENFLQMVEYIDGERSAYVSVDRVSTPDSGLLLNTPVSKDLAKLEGKRKCLSCNKGGGHQSERRPQHHHGRRVPKGLDSKERTLLFWRSLSARWSPFAGPGHRNASGPYEQLFHSRSDDGDHPPL